MLNQTEFIIPKPEHSQETLDEHNDHVKKIDIRYNRTKNAMEAKKVVLESLTKGRDDVAGAANAHIELAKLENTMEEAEDAMDKGSTLPQKLMKKSLRCCMEELHSQNE